jgi:hypothetical protein
MSATTTRPRATSRPIIFLASAVVIPLVALAVAACGGGGSAAMAATPKTPSGESAIVDVSRSSLGSILVNSNGRTDHFQWAAARRDAHVLVRETASALGSLSLVSFGPKQVLLALAISQHSVRHTVEAIRDLILVDLRTQPFRVTAGTSNQ